MTTGFRQPIKQHIGRQLASISWRLPLLVFLVLVLVIGVVSLVSGLYTRAGLEDAQEGNLETLALIQSLIIEKQLNEHAARLEQLVQLRPLAQQAAFANGRYEEVLDTTLLLQENRRAWQAALEPGGSGEEDPLVRRVRNDFSTQLLTGESENIQGILGVQTTLLLTDRFGGVVGASYLPGRYDYSQTEWWRAAMDSEALFITQPRTSVGSTGIPFISRIDFSIPVRDEAGDIVGVLYSAYDYQAIREQIQQGRASSSARTALVNGEGAVLFVSPLYTELGNEILPMGELETELVSFTGPAPNERAFVGRAVPLDSSINAIEALDWHMVGLQPQADVLAPITGAILPSVVIAVGLGFLIVGLLNLAYILPLTRALNRLREGAQDLELGNLATRVEVKRRDELGILAGAFNRMAGRLQGQIEELDEFAYVVSHDLKAPLRNIDNLSTWIVEDLGDDLPEEVGENVVLLRQRVGRMQTLIDDVLTYSRAGRLNVDMEAVDVDRLLADIIDLLVAPADFTVDVAPNMPVVWFPRVQLEQIFTNLLSNAVKYGQAEGGHVQVNYRLHDGYYRFTVSDNGQGIDPADHETIFKMFQTLSAKGGSDSTGVGLAIIKKIVEMHGGQVGVESEVGEGSTFWFTVPIRKEPLL